MERVWYMNYYISDLHLFSRSQLDNGGKNFDNRKYSTLEEMHEDIKKRWNAKVTNGDHVYILGDISGRGRNEELIAFVARLKGKKILVRGNHDDTDDFRYAQLFTKISDYEEIYDNCGGKAYRLILCHYPILMWNGQHKGTILLYGHTHDSYEDRFFQDCINRMNNDINIRQESGQEFRAYNVGCMKGYMDYTPASLKEIIEDGV